MGSNTMQVWFLYSKWRKNLTAGQGRDRAECRVKCRGGCSG